MQAIKAQSRLLRGVICAALGGICWGFSGTCAQMLMSNCNVPVFWITPFRMFGASLCFLIVLLTTQRSNFFAALRDKRSMIIIVIFSLLGILMTQLSYLTAISYTNSGIGTVLERTGLVFIMLVTCIKAKRLPRNKEVLGLILALLGTSFIAFQGDYSHLHIAPQGLFWGIMSGVSMCCYTMIAVGVLEKWGSLIVVGLAMFIGGGTTMAVIQPWHMNVPLTFPVVAGMIAIITVGTLGAYILYLQGVRDAGPVRASLIGCMEPISATVISALWLHTHMSFWDIFGCGLIIAMMFLVVQRDASPATPAEPEDPSKMAPLFQGRASKLGMLSVHRACLADLPQIHIILTQARKHLQQRQIHTGIKPYPSVTRLRKAISRHECYIVNDSHGRMVGFFGLTTQPDPWYSQMSEGSWITQERYHCSLAPVSDGHADPVVIQGEEGLEPLPELETRNKAVPLADQNNRIASYATLRWVSVGGDYLRCGVGAFMVQEAERLARNAGFKSLRCDIYPNNKPMSQLLKRENFTYCGVVHAHASFAGSKERIAFEKLLR